MFFIGKVLKKCQLKEAVQEKDGGLDAIGKRTKQVNFLLLF